jgi:hypothetical protein
MKGEMTAMVLALVLSLGGTATAQPAATASGMVVDPIGAAVTDVRVALTTADRTPVQAATGVKGTFTFPDVPAGSYVVRVDVTAAPLTSRQKFTLAAHETLDWTVFAGASVAAALDQSTAAHPGFGDGPSGYAKRWAASFADDRTGDLLSHYVFTSVFRQDPRYFYQGAGNDDAELCPDCRPHRRRGSVERRLPAFGTRREFDGLEPRHRLGEPGGESCHAGIPRQTTHNARAGWRVTPTKRNWVSGRS